MACDKQERVQNHPTLMKSQTITALVFAAGFLTTTAFADNPPAKPALSTTPVTAAALASNSIIFSAPLSSIAKLVSPAPAPTFTIDWIIPSAHDLSVQGQFANWRPQMFSDQLLSDADADPTALATAAAVSARPPSTVDDYDPFAMAYRDPPVFFRVTFLFGRRDRS